MTTKQLHNEILRIIKPLLYKETFVSEVIIYNKGEEILNVPNDKSYFLITIRQWINGDVIDKTKVNEYIYSEDDLKQLTDRVSQVLSILANE